MDLSSITPQQKMLAGAAANVLFIISLFFPWFGEDVPEGIDIDASFSGREILFGWFILLLMAGIAAALLAAVAFDYELPVSIPPLLTALYLSSIPFWCTLLVVIDGPEAIGRKWGLFLGLVFTVVATGASFLAWRESEG